MDCLAVVMAGGRGERFWPRSRKKRPKQCLDFAGQGSLLQLTVKRLARVAGRENVLVITGADMVDQVAAQLPQLAPENILVEPVGRNTAPCVALAALWARRRGGDPVLLVSPADHAVQDEKAYVATVRAAVLSAAAYNRSVTLGIRPTRPETGYGYLDVGERLDEVNGYPVFAVRRFVEKPDRATAEEYLAQGHYLWNSGLFFFRTSAFLGLVEKYLPGLYARLPELAGTLDGVGDLGAVYGQLEKVSLDYGIAEKDTGILVIPASFGWDDVGSWTALERLRERDGHGNVLAGPFVGVDVERCIIQGGTKPIVGVGLQDLIVVDEEDAILICARERVQDVRLAVAEIKKRGWEQLL
ncbi:MAG TPA: mannose-1-phosphate guanylyltransferase [Spirochaetia bacterium]|nr:mannose-1-phosphate guanylyltransferase [Spirochaetia bacterium]